MDNQWHKLILMLLCVGSCEHIVDPAGEQRGPAINFLRELFVLSKPYPPDRRARWYDPLFEGIDILLPAIMVGLKDARADFQERQMR